MTVTKANHLSRTDHYEEVYKEHTGTIKGADPMIGAKERVDTRAAGVLKCRLQEGE